MIDLSANIISYKSVGNISIGENISIYLEDLYKNHNVKLSSYYLPDGDYGFCFTLPSPYDEIADYIKDIPFDLKLNEIYVADNSLWDPKKIKVKKSK